MIVSKIDNDLERGFVKHRLNCPLITDPRLAPVNIFSSSCDWLLILLLLFFFQNRGNLLETQITLGRLKCFDTKKKTENKF